MLRRPFGVIVLGLIMVPTASADQSSKAIEDENRAESRTNSENPVASQASLPEQLRKKIDNGQLMARDFTDAAKPALCRELKARMMRAYADTNAYVSVTRSYWIYKDSGLATASTATGTVCAFDRSRNSIRIESTYSLTLRDGATAREPSLLLVGDGETLRFRDPRRSVERHVERPVSKPLTYSQVMLAAPPFDGCHKPCCYLLLGKDPLAVFERCLYGLGKAQVEALPPRPKDDPQRPGLRFTPKGHMRRNLPLAVIFWLDPRSHLVTQVTTEGQGRDYLAVLDIDVRVRNQPLDRGLFTFNAHHSKPVDTYGELSGRSKHPLVGHPAPVISLKTMNGELLNLADAKEDVIILDFWFAACGFCIAELPRHQELHNWAKESGVSVGVYCLNPRDAVEEARKVWQKHRWTMPVLMDVGGKIAKAYGVKGYPSTFVIYRGKVIAGPHLGRLSELKLLIDSLLEDQKAEPAEGG